MASAFDSIRESVPWMKDLSDEEVLRKTSDITGMGVQDVAEYFGAPTGRGRSALSAGVRSGWEGLKGIGYSGAGALGDVGNKLGIPRAGEFRDWANQNAAQRNTASELESRPELENIEDVWSQPSKWGPYGVYQIGKQVPQLAGTVAATAAMPEVAVPAWLARGATVLPKVLGGGGMRAGMGAAEKLAAEKAGMTFGKSLLGGAAVNEAQAVGSLYQEAVEGGRPDASGEAFLKSIPYAAAETGPEAMLLGRIAHGSGIKGNIAKRMGISGAVQGAAGATSESVQNELEMSMRGDLTPEQIASRRLNAPVAGGLVEGVLGGVGGIRRARAPLDTKQPANLLNRAASTDLGDLPLTHYGPQSPQFDQNEYEQTLYNQLNQPPAAPLPATPGTVTPFTQEEYEAGLTPTQPGLMEPFDVRAQLERLGPRGPAAPVGSTKPKAVANAQRDSTAVTLDPVAEQIRDTKTQIAAAHAAVFPEDQNKKPHLIRQEITRWVGDPKTVEEAVATLKTKIAATLAPAQGKGSRAERDIRAERMIQLHDELLGLPENERLPLDQWRTNLEAQDAETARAAALANAKVGQEGQVPGAVTVTTGAQAAGVPAKPKNAAELEAYKAAITPHLLAGVKPEELEALQLVHGAQTQNAGDEEAVVASLRAASKESGIPHTTLADRAGRAITQITANAAKVDLPPEAAKALLGMQTSLDVMDVAVPTGAYEGTQRVNMAPSDDFAETEMQAYEPDLGNEAREVAAPQAAAEDTAVARAGEEVAGEEAATEGEAADTAVKPQQRAEFENKWVDAKGQDITHADVQDAQEEYDTGRAADEPAWGVLSPKLQLQWVRGYIAAYDLYPKSKQAAERGRYKDVVRERMLEAGEQEQAANEPTDDGKGQEGADDAGAAQGVGREVGVVQAAVPAGPAERVPPAAAGKPKDAGGEKPAVAASAGQATEKVVKRKRKVAAPKAEGLTPEQQAEVAKTPPTTPEEKQALETSAERAQRKWSEAAGHVPGLGKWSELSAQAQDKFRNAAEKDQTLADAVRLKEGDKGDVQRSEKSVRGEDTETRKTATTAAHIRSSMKRLFWSDKRFDQKVTVFQSLSDVPAELQRRLKLDETTQAVVDNKTRQVYMIADNIDRGDELAVFLHEVGVHLGMEGLIGKTNMVQLAKQVMDWSELNDGSPQSIIAKQVLLRLESAQAAAEARGQKFTDANLVQETIAYFVEEAVNHGINPTAVEANTELGRWFRKLWAAAKVALRKIGLDRFDSLTAQDVVNLAHGAARLELEGTWHGTAAAFRAFNHRFMGTGEGAQAYGWGTYLAQRKGIARDYWATDTRRKSKLGQTHFTYDGEAVNPDASFRDPVQHARLAAGMWKAGMTPVDPKVTYREEINYAYDGKVKDFYTKAQAEYEKLDMSKVGMKQDETVAPKGSLMRVDVGIADDEWLDYDQPFSKQSPKVRDALNKLVPEVRPTIAEIVSKYAGLTRTLPDKKQGARIMNVVRFWELNHSHGDNKIPMHVVMKQQLGAEDFKAFMDMRDEALASLFTPIRPEMNGERIYDMLAVQLGSKKAASQALDKVGIKGNRFFDAKSRGVANTTLYINGKEVVPSLNTPAPVREAHVRILRHGGSVAFALAEARSADASPEEISYLETLRSKKVEARTENKTNNFVVFNEDNIHRAVSWRGAESDDIQFSVRAPTKAAATKQLTNAQTFAQKHGLGFMITEDVADLATHNGLPEARAYVDTAKEREAARVEFELPVGKVAEMYDALPEKERGIGPDSVNQFIQTATMSGSLDGLNQLSAAGQALAKAVFKHGSDTLALKKKLIAEEVGAEFDRRIAEEADDAAKTALRKERDQMLRRFSSLLTIKNSDTYAPLKRFGDYIVEAKSKAYTDAEESNDQKWIRENEADPAHRQVHFTDTQGEADALAAGIKQDMNFSDGDVYAAARAADPEDHRDLFRAFPVLQRRLAAESKTDGASPMTRIMRDLYLQALAETSARKAEMRRAGIAGASTDMVRAFVTQGRADAHFLSNLKHNEALQDAVQAMREGAKRDRRTLTPYLNEMLKRHDASYESHSNSLANRFKRVTSIWMLATNPTYYLQQLVQPWAMSLPVIAGTHGYFRTVRALQEGYRSLSGVLKDTGLSGAMDWSKAPEDVRDMLHAVSRSGAIDVTNSMDQGEWQTVDKGKTGAAWNRIDQKLRGMNTRVEAINRAATAIAAYRMGLARNGGDKAAATVYAERMVRQTHGSYDGANTPRYMQGPVAQVVTQFRRFQIIQLSLLARLAHTAFKGSSKEEKAIARRALTYTLMHAGALGGALGMPGAQVITALVARLFGPDDEPPDFEKEARELIGDQVISDLLLKGVPAMLGVDLSSKLGMGQVLSIAPFADFPTDRKSAEKYVTGVLGPVVGLGLKAVDGLDLIYKGSLSKGAEQLLPTGFANAMKAYRTGTEGVTMRSGDTVLGKDDISFMDSTFQALGMPTTTITHQQRLGQTKYEFDTYYKDRATELIRDFQQARKAGEATGDVIKEWNELQAARVRNGYTRQPMSTLIKSAQQQAKNERNTAGGVEFTKANKRFIQTQANL